MPLGSRLDVQDEDRVSMGFTSDPDVANLTYITAVNRMKHQ